jgi:DNA-nicking Smr family endonuclease
MAKDKPFNNPCEALKAQSKPTPEPAKPAAAKQPAPATKKKQQQVSVDEESALFLSAMGAFEQVKPVSEPRAPAVVAAQQQKAADDDTESLIELAEMVVGDADLVVEQTPASVLVYPQGFDPRLLGKLPATAQLDLQPISPAAIRQTLERFIADAHTKGERSVRVLTGLALRDPTLDALTSAKLARRVLAFSGGVDTLDVLLRRTR